MSVYGKKVIAEETVDTEEFENESVIGNYIQNNFLESTFNENAIALREKINNISENSEFYEFASVVNSILESDIVSPAKILLLKEALNNATISSSFTTDDNSTMMESVLLEYSGNDEKNKEFIGILNDVEVLINTFIENFEELVKYLDKMLEIQNQIIKKPKTYKDGLQKVKDYITEYNQWSTKLFKKTNYAVTMRSLQSKSKKFNNKYSTVTMEEKKKLNEKLDKFIDHIDNVITPWAKNGKSVKDSLDNFDKLKVLDKEYYETFFNVFCTFYNKAFKEAQATLYDIVNVIRILDIAKEKTLSYKIVQAIFKK